MVRSNDRRRSGQAALLTALTVPLTFGLLGLVVDVGWSYWRQEACRTAAQSAAFASARAAYLASNQTCGSGVTCAASYTACPASPTKPPSSDLQNGCLYAAQNGFTQGGSGGRQSVKYQANTTASPVTGVNPAYWVRFMISEKIPTLFSAVLGQPWMVVSARSTGGTFNSAVGGCIYILDPHGANAWQMSGGTLTTGCGIIVASDNAQAGNTSGGIVTLGDGTASSPVKFTMHGGMHQVGGIIQSSSNLLQNQTGNFGDPMSGEVAPTPGGCLGDPAISGGTSNPIAAGTYCSGITISGGNGIVFPNGTINITGGSLNISGGNFSTAAGGVNIYVASTATGVNISGGNGTITAKSGGGMDSIAIWVAATGSSNVSGSNVTINGIIYTPNQTLTYSGSNTGVNQSIIAKDLVMSGGNISQSATSSLFSNGASPGGAFTIE